MDRQKYRILRGLTLDGPAYKRYWRLEAGEVVALPMVKPDMILHLLAKGVIEEVTDDGQG